MGIRFIYGRAGSGKTHFCLNQIAKKISNNKNNKLIMIVPEQYTFQMEKDLLSLAGEKALLRAEVLSFKRMAHRVFEECGGRINKRMKEEGKSMLIYKILQEKSEELEYFSKISKKQGFIDIISKTFTEFKKYNISKEILLKGIEDTDDEELKEKLLDLSYVFDDYNEKIKNNFIDSDDDLTVLAKRLKHCKIYEKAEIWIDEFTTFTPQQMEVIRELARISDKINITLCMDVNSTSKERITDIFNAINNTEKRIIEMMEENNIGYLEPIDINKKVPYRFKDSKELAHIENHFFSYPFNIYKGENNAIRLYKANNSYDEVENVAKDIVRLVRDKGYRYKDISVVCRDIKSYEKITSVIFSEYNIPYFLDKKIEVLSNPLVILIISVFEIYIQNWSYESVFKYLKSGFINIDRDYIDKLENYVLAHGIKGNKWRSEEVNNGYWDSEDIFENPEELEIKEIMEEVRKPILNFHKKIDGKKSVREICIAIYEFLLEVNAFETTDKFIEKFTQIGLESKVKEYEQVPGIVMEILDQAVEVLGEDKVTVSEFYKILNTGFENKEIGVIPVALDQVNIGDIARIKGRDVKALYIIGVNDGVLPSANKEEGILSDLDRDKLKELGIELASTTKARAFEEQFMVYTALTISNKYMMISYPMADFEGKSLRPSIIIPRIKRVIKNLEEESDIYNFEEKIDKYYKVTTKVPTFNELIIAFRKKFDNEEVEEYWNEVYSWFLNNPQYKDKVRLVKEGVYYTNLSDGINKNKIKSLYENDYGNLRFDVSRLEKYAQCPFSYFVKYGLKAKDRKIYEFSAPDIGSFMHEILDKFTNKIKDENILWSQLDKDKCKSIVDELINSKLSEQNNFILNSNNRYKYFTERFKRIITKSVTVISEQMRRGEFEIFKNEFSFGNIEGGEPIKLNLPSGERVQLTGRIDRIDKLQLDGETYIRIVDYKSGAKKFDLTELYYGLQMQLLVYLDALIRNSEYILNTKSIPGAILYFRIDDPIINSKKDIDIEEIQTEILKELKMDGLLLKDAKVVRAMDKEIDSISLIIPAKFNKDGTFSKTSSVVTEEQFELLRKYVNEKMIELCEDMLSGKIKIEPTKIKKKVYCEYCEYSSICQFDTSIKDNKYKLVLKKENDDIWNNMSKKINGKGEV